MENLKRKLQENKLTIGSWITMGHLSIVEIMAKAGYEWLTVDMEHSAISIDQAQNLILAIEATGCFPLVRVGENNPNIIKRVMDTGARGVIVPMVNTKEDAIAAVGAVNYPSLGTRGVGLARAQGYGFEFDKYKDWLKKECVVIVQIEHIRAIENLEEILSVPGVDGSIIGPYDLSGSLGYPGEFEREEVKQALEYYEAVCSRMKKPLGFHVVQPDANAALAYIHKGYNFLAVGVDMLYLGKKCQEVMTAIKK